MTWFADDYQASRQWPLDKIEELALKLRRHCGYLDGDALELISLLEELEVKVVPTSEAEMGGAKALAHSQGGARIAVTHGLYKSIMEGDPSARYEFGHELGHLVMHRSPSPKALSREDNKTLRFIPPDFSVETQAWQYSRSLFVPRVVLQLSCSDADLAAYVGVPEEAVKVRRTDVATFESSRSRRNAPSEVQQFLLSNRSGETEARQRAAEKSAQAISDKMRAWEACGTCPGKEPISWRLSRGFLIAWHDFGKEESQCGWTLKDGEARAYMELKSS